MSMSMARFIEVCNPDKRGPWAVLIPCDGGAKSREGCDLLHAAHEVLHSTGLNRKHAEVVAENWSGRVVRA